MGQFPALPLSPTGPAASGWNATMPRINLAGSWLDLDSDNEDEPARAMQLTRRPRKRSTSPSHESGRSTLSSLKDKLLSRRGSMNFLKLASRPYLHEYPAQQHTYLETTFLHPYVDVKPESTALERLAVLLYSGDKYVQADTVFGLGGLACAKDPARSSQTLRGFVEAVCKVGLPKYWCQGEGGASGEEQVVDGWFVDWVLMHPRKTILEIYSSSQKQLEEEEETRILQCWASDTETQGAITLAVWRKWWSSAPVFHELLEMALQSTDLFTRLLEHTGDQTGRTMVIRNVIESNLHGPVLSPQLPPLDNHPGDKDDTQGPPLPPLLLLTSSLAYALVREMPSDSRHAWECIFSSKRDGHSWSTFQNAVERRGSILLLVREKKKKGMQVSNNTRVLFGAYIGNELVHKPTWHGSSDNVLFAIGPNNPARLAVFRATGFNDHYQYFNYATKTLPNGIGVGGQMGHFGLWIDDSLSRGSTNIAATYDSKQLSQNPEFEVDVVEAWLVRPAKRNDDDYSDDENAKKKKSAMDANPDAVALLEMANRPMYSKMVRDPDMD
ncbi:hypothetical protein IWW48_004494 [Coemansia sp. RSA 1200]|nr:hypothetical protein IWW48_004494 [Coemansia sp. RSA 1200]